MRTVLRGGSVIDGTGAPAREADIVIEGDRIASVDTPGTARGDEVVDLDGLALTPGFIDIHTHLDCQIFWDEQLTPSSWHGVTSVVMGNCGFTIAPTRPEHRDTIVRTLENVEGMSVAALEAGIDWSFESFPEYIEAVRRRPKSLNVGTLIGHSAVRLFVMGAESTERPATETEIAEMRTIVRDAMAAGALGFSTSQTNVHIGAYGKPVPSRLASRDEVFELSLALRDVCKGTIAVAPGTQFSYRDCAELSEATGRPLTWPGLLTGLAGAPGETVKLLEESSHWPGNVTPQTTCRPLVAQTSLTDFIQLTLISEAFRELAATDQAGQYSSYRSPEWRARAKAMINGSWKERIGSIVLQESDRHEELLGKTLGELAAERGVEPLDAMIDIGLEADLKPRFMLIVANDDENEVGALLADARCIVGLSDAGAHVDQICDAIYPTHLLSHWVRDKKRLSLEFAIWRLTGQPAKVFGIAQRGRIAPGYFADLVAFDPHRIGAGKIHRVYDFPANSDRLIAHSEGIEHIWVNGVQIRRDGEVVADARPGQLLEAL